MSNTHKPTELTKSKQKLTGIKPKNVRFFANMWGFSHKTAKNVRKRTK